MTRALSRPWRVPISLLASLAFLAALAVPAAAQEVIAPVEDMPFDRPESWALKYFNAVTMLTSLGPPLDRRPGAVEVGFEAGWIPHLSTEERRVGFDGTKVEDLNKLPAFGRPRVTIGLPWSTSLDIAWAPPIEINGVRPNLVALGLERPVWRGSSSALGLRVFGQTGKVKADFTCSADDVGDPVFGCEAVSRDEVTLRHSGLAITAGWWPRGASGLALHAGAGASYLDSKFQVDARTFGFIDRTLLLSDGFIYSANAGVTVRVTARSHVGFELFYSPLSVRRDGRSSNDALFNARLLARYAL